MCYCDKKSINYNKLIDDSMRLVVYHILKEVSESGLPGKHYFYITFSVQEDGVVLPDSLKKSYPDSMTIVLQHQFWDLSVKRDSFRVTLIFDHLPTAIVVPFSSLLIFSDPFVNFSLHFMPLNHAKDLMIQSFSEEKITESAFQANSISLNKIKENNIIQLDRFRLRKDES